MSKATTDLEGNILIKIGGWQSSLRWWKCTTGEIFIQFLSEAATVTMNIHIGGQPIKDVGIGITSLDNSKYGLFTAWKHWDLAPFPTFAFHDPHHQALIR